MSVKFHEGFSLDSAQVRFWWMDHFLGDQIQDEWRTGGTGSAAVVDAQTGGIARLTTGATTNDAYQIDWLNYRILLVSKKLTHEIRLKLTQTTNVDVFISLRFDANNRIYFRYSSAIGVNWQIACINAGAGAAVDTGIAADTSYHIFRIECFPTGEVHFYIDGVATANSPITTNITAQYLQPWHTIQTLADVVKSVDIDYVAVRQNR